MIEKKFGSPTITKDGVTVAKEIELKDPMEKVCAQLVKEVASKTSDVAGDGTTTATVLAQAIFREGVRTVAAGANPMALRQGIEKAVIVINGKRGKEGNQVVLMATSVMRPTTALRWAITVLGTSTMASFWAWAPGAAGDIATAGAGIAL